MLQPCITAADPSSISQHSDRLQPRHRRSAAWASTTFPLAARSEFPPESTPRTWSRQPSRVGAPDAVSSAVCVCALHLWETSGRLLGRTECHHAPNQWTPRLTEHPTNSRSQQFHHVVMHFRIIRAAPPWVIISKSMYILPPLSAVSFPGSQAVCSPQYLGVSPLGGCI